MRVLWAPRALQQVTAAHDFYEAEGRRTGERFQRYLQATLNRIREYPQSTERVAAPRQVEVRRALVRRFGYWVIYQVVDERTLIVLSFWPTRMDPKGWHG